MSESRGVSSQFFVVVVERIKLRTKTPRSSSECRSDRESCINMHAVHVLHTDQKKKKNKQNISDTQSPATPEKYLN